MRKIPTLFLRDPNRPQLVTEEVNPECSWVMDDEGYATQKRDGTAVMVFGPDQVKAYRRDNLGILPGLDYQLWRRYQLKARQTPPPAFIVAGAHLGKIQGWVPCDRSSPADKYHFEAFDRQKPGRGTYELVGPKVQSNPENIMVHTLIQHGAEHLGQVERSFAGIRAFLQERAIEGIVFHNGSKMAKVKRKDFGFAWPALPGEV